MTITAIVLIVASAFTHAGWNFIGKKNKPDAAFCAVALAFAAMWGLPVLLYFHQAVGAIPAAVWAILLVSVLCETLYYVSLSGSYRHGDMSVVYPIARSVPVLLVVFVSVALGRGDEITQQCVIGAVMVAAGCLLLPVSRMRQWRIWDYINRATALALMAAVGTVGYSMMDDQGIRLLRNSEAVRLAPAVCSVVYVCFIELGTAAALMVVTLVRRQGRGNLRAVLSGKKRQAWMMGSVSLLTYGLVLVSMNFVNNVSYVVAFRQLSIPIGAAMGVVLLKESLYPGKVISVGLIVVGLVMVALG